MANSSSTLRVPIRILEDCVKEIDGFADENADIFDKLLNGLRCLKGGGEWVGASADALITATEKNKKQFAMILKELSDLSKYIDSFVKELEKEDAEAAQKIRAAVDS